MATETIEGAAPAKHRYIGPVFDGDTHLYETPDAFSRYMPKEYAADWQLHYKVGDDGKFALYVGPRKVEISADYMTEDQRIPPPGKLHEWLRAQKEGKSEVDMRVPISAEMTDPAERVKYLDKWNVRSSLLYCGNFVSAISYLDEIKPAYAVLEAYNRWMLDQWTFNYHDRIIMAPIVTLADVDLACAQVRWCIEKGAKAILMPMGPFNNKAPAHTDHDRFWAIVNEAKLRVIFHVSEAIYMKHHMAVWGEPVQQSRLRQTAFVWMHGYSERPVIETLSSFVFWNFFERFPNIKLVSAENGAEWVPAMLVKMDKCRGMAKNGFWPAGQLKERPSKIFMKNIMVVAYPEDDIASIVEQTGNADWLLMGTDYPHSEGVPEPHDFADEACTNLSDEDTRKVMYENGMKLMGYPL
jgi:predicted TIM-barrel fold metal-dependent hydrolase